MATVFFNQTLIKLLIGGMIMTEHTIFILNAFLSPFVWLVDPWHIRKVLERKVMLHKVKTMSNKIAVTQKEANE